MKWIGQHIWDLTSRFRNDVYLEGLAETAETRGLVVDANGKVSINPLSGDEHATHVYENVRNDEGATIPVGTPVYSKGEVGGSERILVGIADASDPAKMPAIGITNTELTTTGDTKDGLITLVGVYNTNLSGFSGVSENDVVYVAVGGGLTITKPTGANLIQNVGIVLKTNGTIIQGLAVTCIGRTNDVPTPLYIDHANQLVGVGITNPAYVLDTHSGTTNVAARFKSGDNQAWISVQDDDSGTYGALFGTDSDAGHDIVLADRSANKRLVVNSSGDVGIGTNNPTSKLSILGGSSGYLFKATGTNTFSIYDPGTSEIGIGSGSSQKLKLFAADALNNGITIDTLGNVGIGTTSPTRLLQVEGDVAYSTGGWAVGTTATQVGKLFNDSGVMTLRAESSRQIAFGNVSGGEAMRIDAAGNVGIGTTSPTAKLHVFGDASDGWDRHIHLDYNGTDEGAILTDNEGMKFRNLTSGNNFYFRNSGNGTSMIITDDHNVGIGNVSPSEKLHVTGNAIITGDLTVQGTTVTLDTTNLNVEDKNITLNYSTGDSSGSADGAGITIQDAVDASNDATMLWNASSDRFDFSHPITAKDSIRFVTSGGTDGGLIDMDSNDDLVISNPLGDVLLGDGDADVFIGDGVNNVDIRFEQSGSITADNASATLTIGGTGNLVVEEPTINNPTFSGSFNVGAKLNLTTSNGYINFDYEPSGDTGQYTTPTKLLTMSNGSEEEVIMQRLSQNGALMIGHDDIVAIAAGDTWSIIRDNIGWTGENVILASEAGFTSYAFANNDTTWSNRNTFRFYGGSATAAENGLYIGDGSSTQFIDLDRNLKNIGTITANSNVDVHGILRVHSGSFVIEDDDSDSVHARIDTNSTEGVLRLNNGANWGMIARGIGNSPRLGAYHNGDLRIYGFGAADGADHVDDDELARFDFLNERLIVNGQISVGGNITTSSNSYIVSSRKFTARDANGTGLFADDAASGLSIADDGDATFTGDVTVNGGDLTITSASTNSVINLNGGDSFVEKDSGTDLYIANNVSDRDIKFRVKDDGTNVIALTLDGSENGNATFSGDVILNGTAPTLRIQDSRNLNNPDWDSVSLGNIEFYTSDTTSPGARVLAEIEAFSNNAAASGPNADLIFKTSAIADSSPQTRLTIGYDGTSTFAGNVTAGSNSLTAGSLDINGDADISGNLTTTGTVSGTTLYGNHPDGNGLSLKLGRADNSNYWEFNHAGNDLRIYNSASSGSDILLGVNASGTAQANNVGIGTATPSVKLDVVGDAQLQGTAPRFVMKETGTNKDFSLKVQTDGRFSVLNDNLASEVLTIEQGGNVGIGTTSPNALLDVDNRIYLQNDGTVKWGASANAGHLTWDTNQAIVKGLSGQALLLGSNNTSARMTIDTSGNVGIGTTLPDHKFHVEFTNGDTSFSGGSLGNWGSDGIRIENTSGTVDTMAMLQFRNADADIHIAGIRQGTNDSDLGFFFEGSEKMRIDSSGNVGIGTTSPGKLLDVNGTFRASGEAFLTGGFDITAAGRFRDGIAVNFNTNRTARIFTDTNDLIIQQDEDDKDIIFKSDDGSGGVTEYFRLDGSAASSGNYVFTVFPDNSRVAIGSGLDIQAWHNGTDSFLYNGTGDFYIQQNADDKDIIFQCDDGSGGQTEYFRLDGTNEQVVFSKNLKLQDNDKLRVGDANDLEIYHDGSNSYIKDAGTGNLKVMANNLYLQNAVGENYINCYSDDRVEIFHNNVKKIETTSTGVDVTGDVVASGTLIAKQYQAFQCNFINDISTTKYYLPLDTVTAQTVVYQDEACMLAHADGRLASVTLKVENLNGASGNITFGIEVLQSTGTGYSGTWTVVETETMAIASTHNHDVFHFHFSTAKHFDSTHMFAISIQSDNAALGGEGGNDERWFVTPVIEWDYNTYLGTNGTSTRYDTTP